MVPFASGREPRPSAAEAWGWGCSPPRKPLRRTHGPAEAVGWGTGPGWPGVRSAIKRWPYFPHRLSSKIPPPAVTRLPGLLDDLKQFVRDHRSCGPLTGDATEPTRNGYLLTVACPSGVVFQRWLTPTETTVDVAGWAKWN
mgnify:CR=1 FL=1